MWLQHKHKERPYIKHLQFYDKFSPPEKAFPEKTEEGESEPGRSKQSLLKCLQRSSIGENVNCDFSTIRKAALVDHISHFNVLRADRPFYTRITSIAWHPTNPNIACTATSGGEIAWYNHLPCEVVGLHSRGIGGTVNGMKINKNPPHIIYTASRDGTVKMIDFEQKEDTIILYSDSWNDWWYTCLDFCIDRDLILAGDSRGFVYTSTPEEYNEGFSKRKRFHEDKVTHIEFCPCDRNIVVTASADHSVKLWDLRMLRESFTSPDLMEPLYVLPHERKVYSAYFNPNDRFSLLTTDQHSDIRLYGSPFWDNKFIIKQPFFNYRSISPIKATWHPLEDLFIAGRYPSSVLVYDEWKTNVEVGIFDGKSGQRLRTLPTKGISSLNAFNVTGDAFLSTSGPYFTIWKDENMMPLYYENTLPRPYTLSSEGSSRYDEDDDEET